MNSKEAEELLLRYKEGNATAEEKALVEQWYVRFKDRAGDVPEGQLRADQQESWARFESAYYSGRVAEPGRVLRLRRQIAAAAAVLLVVGAGLYFYIHNRQPVSVTEGAALVEDAAPGGNRAILTLANGRTITLSDAKKGVLIERDQLSYDDHTAITTIDAGEDGQVIPMLTASTPRGGTYQFTLPDGTKVWLNADSKLEFPSNFVNSKTRNVILSGEGYFEVTKDKLHPFIVESRGQSVKVLGTHFNINAYAEEANAKTTLLEGSVAVNGTVIKPGEQAVQAGRGIKVKQVAADEAVAWKEGVFVFNSTPLDEVMRQVARWYNVAIIYENPELKGELMGGSVSRYDKVSRILKTLENTGAVKFKIAGGKVYVRR